MDLIFTTEKGLPIATGHQRVVIGGRGPYIEFSQRNMDLFNLFVPQNQAWRLDPKYQQRCYYHEYRSRDKSYIKVYFQIRRVDYADYCVSFYYVSPFDLYIDGVLAID